MKCFYCEKEFTLNGKLGGQNRIFCYDCIPSGLERRERNNLTRTLYRKKAEAEKVAIGCQKCGYNKYGGVLEWHHLEPHEKEKSPSDYLTNTSQAAWEAYKAETEKCILLCANCHREWHIEHNQ